MEGFTLRIEVTIPPGLLAGYYIGRIDNDLFGLFGYGFDHNEGISEEPIKKDPIQSGFLYDLERNKPLSLERLFWYGFNKIVLNSSTEEEITTLLGPPTKGIWLNCYGDPTPARFTSLSYKNHGLEFCIDKNSVVRGIRLSEGWHGRTEDGGVHIGSSLAAVNEKIKRTDCITGTNLKSGVHKYIGINFVLLVGNSVATPRGKKIYSSLSFDFDSPISDRKPPFPDIPITKISLEFSCEDEKAGSP